MVPILGFIPKLERRFKHCQKVRKGGEGRSKARDNPNDLGQIDVRLQYLVGIDCQVLTPRKQD
jgi:hypothetical protein